MIDILPGIRNTSAALSAERVRLDIIAENIANAQTTRTADGGPYRRKVVIFEQALRHAMGSATGHDEPTLRVARIEKDQRPMQTIHRPGHPDADARGMVMMPNVNIHEEMADMITASRAFEANLAVVKNARSMALQTLTIGKR